MLCSNYYSCHVCISNAMIWIILLVIDLFSSFIVESPYQSISYHYSYISVTKVTYRIRDTVEYSILLRYINYIYILYSIYCTFQVSYILVRQSSCLCSLEAASVSCVMFCYTRSRNICFQYFVVNIVFPHFITIVIKTVVRS
jgi:hypothetical protein